jgi:hypothetical protein
MRTKIIPAIVLSLTALTAFAQHDGAAKKPLSPAAKAEAKVAGKYIQIDYSAPSKRDRKIMGELVPYGQVWRTGANSATTLTTDASMTIGKLKVPAGKYTLYTIPDAKGWTLIVNKQTGQWGTSYDEKQDLGRVPMTVKSVATSLETFNIAIKPTGGKKANLVLAWENVEATAPLAVN